MTSSSASLKALLEEHGKLPPIERWASLEGRAVVDAGEFFGAGAAAAAGVGGAVAAPAGDLEFAAMNAKVESVMRAQKMDLSPSFDIQALVRALRNTAVLGMRVAAEKRQACVDDWAARGLGRVAQGKFVKEVPTVENRPRLVDVLTSLGIDPVAFDHRLEEGFSLAAAGAGAEGGGGAAESEGGSASRGGDPLAAAMRSVSGGGGGGPRAAAASEGGVGEAGAGGGAPPPGGTAGATGEGLGPSGAAGAAAAGAAGGLGAATTRVPTPASSPSVHVSARRRKK